MSAALEHLARRGLLSRDEGVEARELGGGVSNITTLVRSSRGSVVVKQALPQLRVADEWLASPERAMTEADALRLAARITPGRVPEVLDADPDTHTLVVAAAPEGWTDWKRRLLDGVVDTGVAHEVGRCLGAWHRATTGDTEVAPRFDDQEAFEQLRVDPYYRTVMRRRPELADAVGRYVGEMSERKLCLVHGDYSPKNVLVGDGEVWVIDWEVAHFGDPAFDLAFMSNHLMLKAIHRPDVSGALRGAAVGFWDGYASVGPSPVDGSYVFGHTGCLMVARVDGKSPAEYLTEPQREVARAIGTAMLAEPPSSVAEAFAVLEERL